MAITGSLPIDEKIPSEKEHVTEVEIRDETIHEGYNVFVESARMWLCVGVCAVCPGGFVHRCQRGVLLQQDARQHPQEVYPSATVYPQRTSCCADVIQFYFAFQIISASQSSCENYTHVTFKLIGVERAHCFVLARMRVAFARPRAARSAARKF